MPTESTDKTNPLAGEKLAPVLFTVRDEDHGLAVCRTLLAHAGAGHTAVIHSRNQLLIERRGDPYRDEGPLPTRAAVTVRLRK